MDCFILALSVVLPLFMYMIVGMLIKYLGILTEDNLKAMNRMIFKILIPLALFFSIYRADLKNAIRPKLYVYAWCGVILVFCFLWMLVRKKEKNSIMAATMVQGMYRSNFVLFGASIAASLCDAEGVASISALAAIIVPTFNVLAVIIFEVSRGGKVPIKKLMMEILKNPLVDAGILGIVVGISPVRFPEIIIGPLENLGNIATPLALVVLGGMLSLKSITSHRRYLVTAVFARLVLIPLVMILAGVWMGFRGNDLVAILAVFAAPTAVASTPMAQLMGGDEKLAGEIVAISSMGCILTIFLWVLLLSGIGYL